MFSLYAAKGKIAKRPVLQDQHAPDEDLPCQEQEPFRTKGTSPDSPAPPSTSSTVPLALQSTSPLALQSSPLPLHSAPVQKEEPQLASQSVKFAVSATSPLALPECPEHKFQGACLRGGVLGGSLKYTRT